MNSNSAAAADERGGKRAPGTNENELIASLLPAFLALPLVVAADQSECALQGCAGRGREVCLCL